MARDFAIAFSTLKSVLAKHAKELSVKTDTSSEYKLVGRCASPFPQHKGQPLPPPWQVDEGFSGCLRTD